VVQDGCCSGEGLGEALRVFSDACMCRARTSVSACSWRSSATPLDGGAFRGAVVEVDRFGLQQTIESELARTRGIRLSN
jgi:hypothetical protein